jgi:hypothetical protein
LLALLTDIHWMTNSLKPRLPLSTDFGNARHKAETSGWGNVGKISISGAPRDRQDGLDADSQLD